MGLDAFGGGIHPEAVRQRDDGANDRPVALGGRRRPANEALVDLDLVERRLLQIAERRITGSEIVEGQPHAKRLEPGEGTVRGVAVGQEHAFGNLQFEASRLKAVIGQHRGDRIGDVRVVELDR